METNIIRAIINLVNYPLTNVPFSSEGTNRVNIAGDSLENYIKNLFAGTLSETDETSRRDKFNKYFSYFGNSNNPPDLIIKNGDAVEVKKVEMSSSGLALNSSYPKAKLFSDSRMITSACKSCENWTVKDIIYVIGTVKNSFLSSLVMVYGMDYAADAEVYNRVKNSITEGLSKISDIELAETNELGRVNKVDPLGITYLRVRGMWHIDNPLRVFSYIYSQNLEKDFNFMALINCEKYLSFPQNDRLELEKLFHSGHLSISDVKISDPNNPAKLKEAKLITFSI